MIEKEWMQLAKKLKGVYQREEKFLPDVETVKQWFNYLDDLDFEIATKAVDKYIREEKFAPTVADIRTTYEDIISSEKKRIGAIRDQYRNAKSEYPGTIEEGYAWEEWLSRVQDERSSVILYGIIKQYIRQCEADDTINSIMDFKECVKTICRDNDKKIFFKQAQ